MSYTHSGFLLLRKREYLRINEPSILEEMDKLYDKIDCNILAQYRNNKLKVRQFKSWKQNVEKWKKKMLEGLGRYIEFECLSLVA